VAKKKGVAEDQGTVTAGTGPVRPVPPEEHEMSFSGPATLVNRFFVTTGPAGVRLAFAEQRNPETLPIFRTAIITSYQDAISFWKLLEGMLAPIEQQLQNAQATSQQITAQTKAEKDAN